MNSKWLTLVQNPNVQHVWRDPPPWSIAQDYILGDKSPLIRSSDQNF